LGSLSLDKEKPAVGGFFEKLGLLFEEVEGVAFTE
jgi:hypothetical protein